MRMSNLGLRSLSSATAALMLLAGLAGCSPAPASSPSPLPSLRSGSPGPSAPSPASPTPTPQLAHYASGELSFDYPASWWLIPIGADQHYQVWGPILGTGHFAYDCSTIAPTNGSGGGAICEAPFWWVSSGQVVVVFRGGASVVAPTPPPDALQLRDGIRAIETEYSTTSVWQISTPQLTVAKAILTASTFTVLADYAAPNVEVSREQVRQLIESMRLSSPPPPASAGVSASS